MTGYETGEKCTKSKNCRPRALTPLCFLCFPLSSRVKPRGKISREAQRRSVLLKNVLSVGLKDV